MKKVSIFGATGSIGTNACKVLLNSNSEYKVKVLSANKNYKKLALHAKKLKSKYAVISDHRYYKALKEELSGSKVKCLSGEEELSNLASLKTDITIAAIVGIAGAMMVTYDGLFTPGSYRPLRYTFLIWVMVIVGGSGNNFGAILGGFVVWFLWIEAAPIGLYLVNLTTAGLEDTHFLKVHLIESVPYFRFLMMGVGLLLIMRYRPKGILPEKIEIK